MALRCVLHTTQYFGFLNLSLLSIYQAKWVTTSLKSFCHSAPFFCTCCMANKTFVHEKALQVCSFLFLLCYKSHENHENPYHVLQVTYFMSEHWGSRQPRSQASPIFTFHLCSMIRESRGWSSVLVYYFVNANERLKRGRPGNETRVLLGLKWMVWHHQQHHQDVSGRSLQKSFPQRLLAWLPTQHFNFQQHQVCKLGHIRMLFLSTLLNM